MYSKLTKCIAVMYSKLTKCIAVMYSKLTKCISKKEVLTLQDKFI
jgi:hypothetical protein